MLSRNGKVTGACHIDFQNGPSYTVLSGDIHVDPQPMIDAGFIHLSGVGARQAALAQNTPLCAEEPIIGDPIVVLGYPSASQTAFVAADGIVAGIDDSNYDLMTAPTDEGDYGGAAIDVPHDCYLGMVAPGVSSASEHLGEFLKWLSLKAEMQVQP